MLILPNCPLNSVGASGRSPGFVGKQMPSINKTAEALTIAEAKARAGCGRSTIYEEIKAGRLPARKLGRRTLILATDFSEWLANLPLAKI